MNTLQGSDDDKRKVAIIILKCSDENLYNSIWKLFQRRPSSAILTPHSISTHRGPVLMNSVL